MYGTCIIHVHVHVICIGVCVQVERCERSVLELQSSVEAREAELGRLRSKVNSLTVATSDLRKELEVKGQEVLTVRRETTNLMK